MVATDFVQFFTNLCSRVEIPEIVDTFFPKPRVTQNIGNAANFAAVRLKTGATGIVYAHLDPSVLPESTKFEFGRVIGQPASCLVKYFASPDPFLCTLGLAGINAISQYLIQSFGIPVDQTTNPLGFLDIRSGDTVGMVGFFPPLVRAIETMDVKLVVIEKKPDLEGEHANWTVTLDPAQLEGCNKVLSTSTTVLNDTLDDVLQHCTGAEKISMVGPSAGFLPDLVFDRGVDVVGGTLVQVPDVFFTRLRDEVKWGNATTKYCFQKNAYKGIETYLS